MAEQGINIQVKVSTWKELNSLKEYGESFNDVIKRLIQNPVNVSSETQHKINQAMEDYGVSSLSELLEMLMERLSGKEEVNEQKSSK